MDLSGPYSKTEDANWYVLTIICMLTNYVFMKQIKRKTTEYIINAYLKSCICFFGSSEYIFSDRDGDDFSKQYNWLAKELGSTKVYTSPYTPTGN